MGNHSFSVREKAQLKNRGITLLQAKQQISRFKKGFSHAVLVRPCTLGKGIFKLNHEEQKSSERRFLKEKSRKKIIKFVPASGAASRMFHFLEDPKPEYKALKQKFLKRLSDFAFYSELGKVLKKRSQNIEWLKKEKNIAAIVSALLEKDGLGYRQAPKGMILFHRNGKKARTAFEDQLREGTIFADAQKKTHIHFTLSGAARAEVRRHLRHAATAMRRQFVLSDSIQSPATDCLAAKENGAPVRDEKGGLLLRPAGHGALLANLNQIKSGLIYVKNIDNILPPENRGEADRWKRVLCGVFLDIQSRIFEAQKILKKKKMTPHEAVFILGLAAEQGCGFSEPPGGSPNRQKLMQFFNRPLRVCGMVPNTGEPGGGPFWVRDANGNVSAQIIEAAEVDFKNKTQVRIWKASTHFNPVDFVCGVFDAQGKKYNLMDFSDPERGLISKKSYLGKGIQVMELPGLWNGGMANWISVFVEIPTNVFAPVKTALDLLRPEHQSTKKRRR